MAGFHCRNGADTPWLPWVKARLKASSWKMKKIAIVTTTNVCRRTRSATSPNGTATAAAASPASGRVAKITSPVRCWCQASSPTA